MPKKKKTCEYCDIPTSAPNFAYHFCVGRKKPRKPIVPGHGRGRLKVKAKKHPLGNSHMATLPNGDRVRVYN